MNGIGFPLVTIISFIAIVAIAIRIDLHAHRGNQQVTLGDALRWSAIYAGLALGFALHLFLTYGNDAASKFLAGWVVEKALSVDNLMVFGAVFAYFGVQPNFQRRILYFGIIGAVFFRLLFVTIGMGAFWLIGRPVEFALGAIVCWSATKIAFGGEEPEVIDHESRWYIQRTKKFLPVTSDISSGKLFARSMIQKTGNVVTKATPYFLCLVSLEMTDLAFSFDSVPAVIAITKDPVLVYSAMVFAILGLRSLYFVLEAMKEYLRHLGTAVIYVLAFIGIKLIVHALTGLEVPPLISLGVVFSVLSIGVIASVLSPKKAGA